MKILENKINGNNTEIVCEIETKVWHEQQDKAFKKLAKNLNIQGFRKGHIPAGVAKSKISEGQILNESINPAIDTMYKELLASKELNEEKIIIDALTVDVKKIDKDNLEIVFKFENYPEITTPDIKTLKVEYKNPTVEDKEVEMEINRLCKNDWMLADKENQTIANGDMANIDFEGFLDDKPFAGGAAKGFDLEVGSKSFIPGFEEQLIGLKKGDKKDIKVSFPKDYFEKSLAGKETRFAITVNNVKEITKPTLDEEYIKKLNLPNVKTANDLKKHLHDQILEMKKLQARDKVIPLISAEIINNTKISYFPDSLVKDEKNRIINDVTKRAGEAKMSYEDFIKKQLGFKDEADFNKNVSETAAKNLTLVLAIEKLIEKLNIKATDKDLNDYFEKVSKYYGMPVEDIKKNFANRAEGLKVFLSQQKLFDEIIKQITAK